MPVMHKVEALKQATSNIYIHLSLDAVMMAGSNLEHIISEPITGASNEIARRIVIRYK